MSAADLEGIRDALRCDRAGCECRRSAGNVHCPAHDDPHPSLNVAHKNGRLLWCCYAGCSQAAVQAALVEHRLLPPMTGTAPQNGASRHVVRETRYELRDEVGRPAPAVHLRRDFSDGDKAMWWEQADGTRGLGGTKTSELPLYGVHELGEACEVVVCEGEQARDAVATLGIPAAGTVTGAAGTPGDAALQPLLRAPTVLLWPDNDTPGRGHMDRVGARLLALGHADVRIIDWPDAPAKGDGFDFHTAGGTLDEARRLIAAAHPYELTRDDESGTAPPDTEPSSPLRFLTAREFAAQTPTETEWVVEPWVPVGGVLKIDGPPKRAGKTTLITYVVKAVLTGGDFLGTPARQGPVILLTEQAGTSFREALEKAGLLDRDDLHLALYRDIAALSWPEVVAETFVLAERIGAVLVVVDTFPQVARVRGDDENSAGRALAAIEPLQVAADIHHVGVIVSFHDRKGGGEVGESGRGSSAFAGAVDLILHINRPGGRLRPTVRKLEALSRFAATPEELYVELTDQGYISLGEEVDVVTAQVGAALAELLPASEDEAKPVAAIKREGQIIERGLLDELASRGITAARSTVDAELTRWREAGYAGRGGEGKRGDPYRWRLLQEPPESFFHSLASGASEESFLVERGANSASEGGKDDVSPGAAILTEEDEGLLSSDDHHALIGRKQSDAGIGFEAPDAEDGWEELEL